MAWKGTELIIRIAADLKKYRDGLREVARDTRQQMGEAARSTEGLTAAHRALEGQAGRTARELLSAGRAAASGDFARAGQDVAELAGGMGRAGTAATGLGSALGVAAAALGAYLVVSYKAAAEHERQANLMALTGNAAGLLAGDVNRMATSVAEAANTTVGASREILEALLGTGKVGKAAMESMAESIALVSRASGESQERVTADFAKMADGVTKWAVEHNERYHFLTVDQYRYIKSLEEAGRTQEAMIATTSALNRHLADIDQNVGYLQGAWRSLASAASSAWDAMLNLGRAETTADKLQALGEKIAYMRGQLALSQSRGQSGPIEKDQRLLNVLLDQQAALQETARLERRSADAKAVSAAATTAQIAKEEEASKVKDRHAGATKRLSDAEREAAKAAQELARARVAAQAMTDRAGEAAAKSADAVMQANQALREEIAMIGASVAERAALVRAKEEQILADQELLLISLQNADADAVTIANLQREIALRRERLTLLDRRTEREAAQAMEQETTAALRVVGQRADTEWDRTSDYLADSLAGALMAGFGRGKGFVDGFVDYLAQQLRSALSQELSNTLKGGFQSLFTGNTSGLNNSMVGAAYQYFTGASTGATSASLAYANMVGVAGGDSIGALYAANGGWAGVSAGTAGTAGSAGAGAAAGSSSSWVAAVGGYAALIAVAVAVADNLYSKGYNRQALGYGKPTTAQVGRTTFTADQNLQRSWQYDTSFERIKASTLKWAGLSEKWVDILSGTTRMSALFGRKLNAYGYEASIEAGNVSVGGFQHYKGGLFRSNKTTSANVDPQAAAQVQQQIEAVQEGTRAMAQALGYSADAVDNYTGKLRINFKGASTAAEQAERVTKAMDDLQFAMLKAASGGKMARDEFDRMMEGVRADIERAGISSAGLTSIFKDGILNQASGQEIGAALSQNILGGIYGQLTENAFAPVSAAIMTQIIEPMFTAMAAGVPLAQAINKAALNNAVAMANQAAAFLNELFSSEEFRAAMSQISSAFSSIGGAAGSVRLPNFRPVSAKPVDTSAADAAREKEQLERELLRLQGNTVELRRRELAALKPANRAIQEQIWALEDLAELKDAWRSLSDSIIEEVERIKGEVLDGPNNRAYLEAQFAVATAAARAGDQAAAEKLPQLSGQLSDLYQSTAESQADLSYLNASLLASLEETRRIVTGFAATGVVPGAAASTAAKAQQVETKAAAAERAVLSDELGNLALAVADQGKSMRQLLLLLRNATNEGAGFKLIEAV